MNTLLLPCLAAAAAASPLLLPVQNPVRTVQVPSRSVNQDAAPAQAQERLFPMPVSDMALGGSRQEGGPSMLDVVGEYGRLTNQAFLHTAQVREILASTPAGISMDVVVPKDQVQGWFEQALVQHGLVLSILQSEAPRMLRLFSLQTQDRNQMRSQATIVHEDELALYSQHPALLVTTSIALERADVRQLSNSLRSIITDANLQSMLPLGDTNSIMITDFGPRASAMAELLREADLRSSLPVNTVDPAPVFVRVVLEHGNAMELAGIVEELVSTARPSLNPRQAGPVMAPSGPVVRVLADQRTNALALMVLPQYRELALEVIAGLDVAP